MGFKMFQSITCWAVHNLLLNKIYSNERLIYYKHKPDELQLFSVINDTQQRKFMIFSEVEVSS